MTPAQRMLHHCQDLHICPPVEGEKSMGGNLDQWLSEHCPGCGECFVDCSCVGVAECYTCDRPLYLCVCEIRETAAGREYP
jgi:hypothetical protein